jgi:hypothetical protein
MEQAMTRALTSPSTFAFPHKFEELPIFWQSTGPREIPWRAGTIDGEAEISFDRCGDWWVSDVWITADNGRCGEASVTEKIRLDPLHPLYPMITHSIRARYEAQVEERIEAEFGEAGLRRAAA